MSQYIKKAYIIDDNEIFHLILEKSVRQTNIITELCFFTNGMDALKQLKEDSSTDAGLPNLILLDINMPTLSGWEFMEQLEIIKLMDLDEMKIFIVSSSNAVEDRNRAEEFSNIADYIVKPISPEVLDSVFSFTAPYQR